MKFTFIKKTTMLKKKPEPLEDWIQRMQKLLNHGKPYTKEERDKMECNYYESVYYDEGTELLVQFILKWHPELQDAPQSLAPYIKTLAQTTFTTLLHRVWENVNYNRQHKSPRDIPNLEFDKLTELLKGMRLKEPSVVTEQDVNGRGFSGFDENDKIELIKEINEGEIKGWKFLSGYARDFISCMQPVFFEMWPELIDMESEWWLLYEFDMLSQSNSLRDRAYTIANEHSKEADAK